MWIGALVVIAVMIYLLRYVWRVLLFGASYQLAGLNCVKTSTVSSAASIRPSICVTVPAILLPARPTMLTASSSPPARCPDAGGFIGDGCAVLIVMSTQISWQLTLLALVPMPFMALAIKRNDALHERFRVAQAAFQPQRSHRKA